MPIYSIDNAYLSYAIGLDLTAFRNGDVPLTAGECQATDLLDAKQQIAIDYSDPETEEVGHMSASQYPIRYTTGYKQGIISIPSYLQSGTNFYATLGTCVTTGSYEHAISLNLLQTPINFALHFKKTLASNNIEYDFLGFMPKSWNLSCGDDMSRWKAKQMFTANFAYTKPSTADLDEPSKQSLSNYEWNELKHASGALDFTYDDNPLEFDVRAFNITVNRTKPLWGARDSIGFPGEAFISGVGLDLSLEGYLKGDNIRTIMSAKPEDYAGDLDGVIKFYKSATREFGITLDKMYLLPDKTILSETDWYERKTLKFVSYSSATSVSGSVKDSLDKTYYEND